ncbi:hypothetical protein ABH905_004113 [Pseudomonas frederiksbergensis]|uniref:hypothetical protein n=1 Tax=Pseudomonas frederiksbergensis TaxID=104087 RepID=UPI003D23C7B3
MSDKDPLDRQGREIPGPMGQDVTPVRLRMRQILLIACLAYLAILVGAFLALMLLPTFGEVGHLEHGCYRTDALLPYVECRGFFAWPLAKVALNLPYQVVFVPMFAVHAAFEFEPRPFLLLMSLGVLLWLPLIYLGWRGVSRLS